MKKIRSRPGDETFRKLRDSCFTAFEFVFELKLLNMKIDNCSADRLRNAELVSLCNEVVEIVKPFDWAAANVLGLFTQTETNIAKFVAHLNQQKTVSETHEVEIADLGFNNAWRAYKYMCMAFELDADDAKRKAAQRLIEHTKLHGYNLHLNSYSEQNARAKMFLEDCNNLPEVAADIRILGIKDFVDQVQKALNTLLEALANRKEKVVSEKRNNDTKLLRKQVQESLDNLFKYIEAMSAVATDEVFDVMIKKINDSIQKLDLSYKLRSTRKPETTEEIEVN